MLTASGLLCDGTVIWMSFVAGVETAIANLWSI
jgi:hypothetical protein